MDKIKTFNEILFEHGIDTMSLNDDFNTQLFHAGERYAEQQVAAALSTQSPKWVKAKDRLPGDEVESLKEMPLRDAITKVPYHKVDILGFDNKTMYYRGINDEIHVKIKNIEWRESSTQPLQEKIDGVGKLFEYLAQYGGKIVCSNELSSEWINQARASGRMYVDDNSIGYIWEPEIKNFPETEEEVLFLEKWYPLKFELPESLKTLDWLHKPINKQP